MPTTVSTNARLLKLCRKLHLYFGLFVAPSLLFFAFTGALQTLSLHEAAGTSYSPPRWLEQMAQVHKNQNLEIRKREHAPAPKPAAPDPKPAAPVPPASAAPLGPPPETLSSKEHEHLPLKFFFILVSLGLFVSTGTGIFMAYKYERRGLVVTGWLLVGTAIPLLLLRF